MGTAVLAHCYFDMLDVCISVDYYGQIVEYPNSRDFIVDMGTYILPYGFNPLGVSADLLYGFAAPAQRVCY
jgi:hypothetical protein